MHLTISHNDLSLVDRIHDGGVVGERLALDEWHDRNADAIRRLVIAELLAHELRVAVDVEV